MFDGGESLIPSQGKERQKHGFENLYFISLTLLEELLMLFSHGTGHIIQMNYASKLQQPPIICSLILEAGSREAARGLPCGLKFEFQAMRGRNEASLFTLSSAKICSREVA